MARFLLDTSFCVHFLRGRPWARRALASVQLADVAVSAVTAGELHDGAHRSASPQKELKKVEFFLGPLEVLPLGRKEASMWGRVEAERRRQGDPLEAEDGMIAATAKVQGFTVVTGNLRHFGPVKGLKVVDWEALPPRAAQGTDRAAAPSGFVTDRT